MIHFFFEKCVLLLEKRDFLHNQLIALGHGIHLLHDLADLSSIELALAFRALQLLSELCVLFFKRSDA